MRLARRDIVRFGPEGDRKEHREVGRAAYDIGFGVETSAGDHIELLLPVIHVPVIVDDLKAGNPELQVDD